jgi:hypothetical protein
MSVSGGGHARPPPHPAGSRPSREQNRPFCTRAWPVGSSRVQNGPSCPRDLLAAASRVQNSPLPPGASHGRFAGSLPAAGGTPFATLTPAPPNVYCVPAARGLVSAGPLPLPVSGGGHARPPQHPAGSRPSREQNGPLCPRDLLAAASCVQNGFSCPRDWSVGGSRVQNSPLCPRDWSVGGSRVQIAPSCPRRRPATASRGQTAAFCTRDWPTGQEGEAECVNGKEDKSVQQQNKIPDNVDIRYFKAPANNAP